MRKIEEVHRRGTKQQIYSRGGRRGRQEKGRRHNNRGRRRQGGRRQERRKHSQEEGVVEKRPRIKKSDTETEAGGEAGPSKS